MTAVCTIVSYSRGDLFEENPSRVPPSPPLGCPALLDDPYALDAVADLDLIDHAHAAGHLAEGGVLAVQEVGGAEHDVDLTAGGVGVVGPRHAQHAAIDGPLVELGL